MPVEPGRHYGGRRLDTGAWVCPVCGTSNTTPLEDGCPSCGTGTVEAAERARAEAEARAKAMEIPNDALMLALVGQADAHTAMLAHVLTRRARRGLAYALAHYADTGTPAPDGLSRAQCLTWGRKLMASVDAEGDES